VGQYENINVIVRLIEKQMRRRFFSVFDYGFSAIGAAMRGAGKELLNFFSDLHIDSGSADRALPCSTQSGARELRPAHKSDPATQWCGGKSVRTKRTALNITAGYGRHMALINSGRQHPLQQIKQTRPVSQRQTIRR
jgi:hypothetical protein